MGSPWLKVNCFVHFRAIMRFNRWPRGFIYSYNLLFDPPEWAFEAGDTLLVVAARKPFGWIAIPGAASVTSSHTDAAILETHRVVVRGLPSIEIQSRLNRAQVSAVEEVLSRFPTHRGGMRRLVMSSFTSATTHDWLRQCRSLNRLLQSVPDWH